MASTFGGSPRWLTGVVAVAFVLSLTLWLHRMPGLLGDEASEGYNVFELKQRSGIAVRGERSYIGPLIDYVRVPFVAAFGYTALAVRVPVVALTVVGFALAAVVARRLFGHDAVPLVVGLAALSPILVTQARLGWAISLLPFWSVVTLAILTSSHRQRPLLTGLALGLGLHTHILFFPFVPSVVAVGALMLVSQTVGEGVQRLPWLGIGRRMVRRLVSWWPAVVGFWAAFATQVYVLSTFRDDQTNIGKVAAAWPERAAALPDAMQDLLSGSAYIARYTGEELPPLVIGGVVSGLLLLILLAAVAARERRRVWLALFGIAVYLAVLIVMIDRYTLRYFLVPVIALWALAGVGLSAVLTAARARTAVRAGITVMIMASLVGATTYYVWWPYLKEGGSTAEFSIGAGSDRAEALVDTRPLLACLKGAGTVYSDDPHIYNRFLYLSQQYPDLALVKEHQPKKLARWVVRYLRPDKRERPGDLCPHLTHFRIIRRER